MFQLENNNQAFKQLLSSLFNKEYQEIDVIMKKFYIKTKPPLPLNNRDNEFFQPNYEIEFEITN